jgi:DNA-binding transcriptional LysR family regulator
MRRPDLAELGAFLAVAERKSFARAADHLGIARSTLSETIRQLEERLGVRLLNRTTRSVGLTDAGQKLMERLRPVIDDFASALESINAFRDKPAGLLRLTVPPPAATYILAPVIARFLSAYPDIRLEISVDPALTDIVAERFDAGIRIDERIERDMIAVRISPPLHSVVVAAPSYLAAHEAPHSPADLAQHNCIRLRFPSGITLPWRFQQDGGTIEVAVDGTLVVNEAPLAMRAAIDGVGLLYIDIGHVAEHAEAGRLVSVLDDYATAFSGFFLYYPSRRQVPAPLQALVEFLRKNLKDS